MPAVLIIDDEPTLAKNIATYLRRCGLETAVAATGEEGLGCIALLRPAAVLVDYALPGISGLDVLKTIKSTSPQTAVIMMTAHGSRRIAVEAMRHGAARYLTKPIVLGELRERLAALDCLAARASAG